MTPLSEVYFLLFVDSLVSALILPLNKVFIFKVMNYFGGYNHLLMVPVASLGSMLGGIINWILGKIVISVRMEYNNTNSASYKLDVRLKFILILMNLLLAWLPFYGALIAIVSGYLRVNVVYITISLFISYIAYYIYLLM